MSQKLITFILTLTYPLLLAFFGYADIYHQHFFDSGLTVIIYNTARLFFIPYLMWFFYIVGDCVLRKPALSIQSALLGFFTGVGIWHIILFFAGLAGLYTRAVMITATLVILAASAPRMNQWINHIRSNLKPIYWPGWLLLVVPICGFLITKGLYPAGGHDYYNHYFQFYKRVIDTGSIMPNEVWYHFYYSKGAGLFFLSMLLTDPLAPQLATTAMIIAAAVMLFTLIKPASTWRLLPWIAVAFYFTFLIYTPGLIQNMHQGGWGDLEKPHEPAAVLMFAILWITIGLANATKQRPWGIALMASVSAIILISPVMAVFTGAYLGMTALFFYFTKQRNAAYWSLSGAMTAGIWLLFLLSLNYYLTGIPQDQGLFIFWPIINFDKVKTWGVLFELFIMHWLKTELVAHQVAFNAMFVIKLFSYLRLDVWWPLFIFALGLFIWKRRVTNLPNKAAITVCGGFLLLILVLSFFIGRDQSISFYRFTSFTYAPMLCFCFLLLAPRINHSWLGSILFTFIFAIILINNFNGGNLGRVMANGLHFATGQYSIADAYRHQRGWPGRMPWGGIYPAAEVVWSQVPANTRIWSFHQHSYCMLPDCRFESFISYRFSPNAKAIYYGDPEAAKAILKKEHLNYFFISNALELSDPLPRAPLFSVNHIAHYLGIAWTDGESTLLTWKEDAREPIDSAWLDRYNRQTNASSSVKWFPYRSIQKELSAC